MAKYTAETLRVRRDEILDRWEKRAYAEVSASLGQTSLVMKDSMADFLDKVQAALEKSNPFSMDEELKQLLGFGKAHGIARAGTANYSIDQLIYEFHILREVLFEVLEEEQPLEPQERNLVITMVEHAVNLSATRFSDTLRSVRERFVSALTHDLKTPVTSALLSAEMILRRPEDPEFCKRKANTIVEGMRRLERMISDVLDASRIGAGEKLDLKLGTFDMKELLEEVVLDSNIRYGNRFTLQAFGPVDGVWDYEGIRRVLENLVNNAAKYSFPDSLVTLGLEPGKNRVRISVHNEGTPISEEQKKILFQQFRRLEAGKAQRGWGLGLLIAKGIVESHGGTISVESGEGRGTTFSLELPRWTQISEKDEKSAA